MLGHVCLFVICICFPLKSPGKKSFHIITFKAFPFDVNIKYPCFANKFNSLYNDSNSWTQWKCFYNL